MIVILVVAIIISITFGFFYYTIFVSNTTFTTLSRLAAQNNGLASYCPDMSGVSNKEIALTYLNWTAQNNEQAVCGFIALNSVGQKALDGYGIDVNLTKLGNTIRTITIIPSSVYVASSHMITNKSQVDTIAAQIASIDNNVINGSPSSEYSSYNCSNNWAGYVAYSNGSNPSPIMNNTAGSWIVAGVSSSPSQAAAAQWLGIDGYVSNPYSIVQTGTTSEYTGSGTKYWAWYELYPNAPVNLSISVGSSDRIFAEVRYQPNISHPLWDFNITLVDPSKSIGQTIYAYDTNIHFYSSEWIMELAPTSHLAKFGTADYGNYYSGYTDNWAVSSSNTVGTWPNTQLYMHNSTCTQPSGNLLAYPSGLYNNEGFTVTRTSNWT